MERLWLVQRDFFDHLSGRQSPQHVLFRHQHMFKGIKVGLFFFFLLPTRVRSLVAVAVFMFPCDVKVLRCTRDV